MDNKVLTIAIDLTAASQPSLIPNEILAESRTSSITDEILSHEPLDKVWDTIIVDFKDIGKISFTKDDIVNSEYGRYFEVPVDYFSN